MLTLELDTKEAWIVGDALRAKRRELVQLLADVGGDSQQWREDLAFVDAALQKIADASRWATGIDA